MAKIGLEEMAGAIARWQDFEDVAAPVDTEERAKEMRRRMDAGESLRDLLAERIREPSPEAASTVRAIARSVGLDTQAYQAFILGMSSVLHDRRMYPIEDAIDTAAFAGLIVGLTARQLADEALEPTDPT